MLLFQLQEETNRMARKGTPTSDQIRTSMWPYYVFYATMLLLRMRWAGSMKLPTLGMRQKFKEDFCVRDYRMLRMVSTTEPCPNDIRQIGTMSECQRTHEVQATQCSTPACVRTPLVKSIVSSWDMPYTILTDILNDKSVLRYHEGMLLRTSWYKLHGGEASNRSERRYIDGVRPCEVLWVRQE